MRLQTIKMVDVQVPKGKFIKVRCTGCKNEQVVFGKCSTEIKCLVCGKTLCDPSGGKSKVKARVLEVLE